jgi:hypothetical protein
MPPRLSHKATPRTRPLPSRPDQLSCPLCPSRDRFSNRSGFTQHWNSRHALEGPIVGQLSARRAAGDHEPADEEVALMEAAVMDALAELNYNDGPGAGATADESEHDKEPQNGSIKTHPSVNGAPLALQHSRYD